MANLTTDSLLTFTDSAASRSQILQNFGTARPMEVITTGDLTFKANTGGALGRDSIIRFLDYTSEVGRFEKDLTLNYSLNVKGDVVFPNSNHSPYLKCYGGVSVYLNYLDSAPVNTKFEVVAYAGATPAKLFVVDPGSNRILSYKKLVFFSTTDSDCVIDTNSNSLEVAASENLFLRFNSKNSAPNSYLSVLGYQTEVIRVLPTYVKFFKRVDASSEGVRTKTIAGTPTETFLYGYTGLMAVDTTNSVLYVAVGDNVWRSVPLT